MKLNHITLIVSNIEESKRFYTESLGLTTGFEEEIGGPEFSKVTARKDVLLRFAVLKIPQTDVILELAELKRPKEKNSADFGHIAFEVDDVDETFRQLKKKKVATLSEPVTITRSHPKINGKRFFYAKDPDGNLIEILNHREKTYSD
ncbi:Metallothiol transferase FosB [uncultured archaeon]|nr:Metallothiol transferase FosB [uncultured archaeon]